MKELELLAKDIDNCLERKESEFNETSRTDAYTLGKLQNRKIEIEGFKKAITNVSTHPFLKKRIIQNFTKKANEIVKQINII